MWVLRCSLASQLLSAQQLLSQYIAGGCSGGQQGDQRCELTLVSAVWAMLLAHTCWCRFGNAVSPQFLVQAGQRCESTLISAVWSTL